MTHQALSTLSVLSHHQKSLLRKGNIITAFDLIVLSTQDIARRCRTTHGEAQEIINTVFNELKSPPLYILNDPELPKDDIITTGDAILDRALGGGLRTRKIWEVTGESAAGKTQLAMQLALCVQLPRRLGGVSGSACFLSTSWTLPTNRLVDMISNHPALSPAVCGLADIHTIKTPTIPLLLHVLSDTLPAFLAGRVSQPGAKPVKLLVIDAITELFHSDQSVSTVTLAERSRNLTEIATLLHGLANKHGIAILVLNEVSDVIDRGPPPNSLAHEVIYRDQARLFNRADSIPGEGFKEAALGLVWANQINARIMLTRTNRMRVLDDTEARPHKRRKTNEGASPTARSSDSHSQEPIRIRRLSVIFSSMAPPTSLDYIITASGFVALDTDQGYSTVEDTPPQPNSIANTPLAPFEDVCPLDIPLALDSSAGASSDPSLSSSVSAAPSSQVDAEPVLLAENLDAENGPQDEDDEWEAYWKDGDLGSDVYSQLDLEALASRV